MKHTPKHKRQHQRFHRNPKARKVYFDAFVITNLTAVGYLMAKLAQEEINHSDIKFVALWVFPFWLAFVIAIGFYRSHKEIKAEG
jgi:hypothetical protein